MSPRTALAALILAAGLASPAAAEPPAGLMQHWQLSRIGDAAAPFPATLDLRDMPQVAGQAPCNRWFATVTLSGTGQGAPAALQFGPIGATRMACADLAAEQAYLQALAAVSAAQLDAGALILTGADGLRLEFQPLLP